MAQDIRAKTEMKEIRREFRYDGVAVMTAKVRYPEITLNNRPAAARINGRIGAQVERYLRYVSGVLYREAVRSYRYSKENNFPIRPFDTVLQYQITYNDNCHLSAYRDQYEYTGGAHGNTVRMSDTWSLFTGRTLPLRAFAEAPDYRRFLLEEIMRIADENYSRDEHIYFDNYRELIVRYFNRKSYYLKPDGLVIFYGQYEIAPYSTGIVEFLIPYGSGVREPMCI